MKRKAFVPWIFPDRSEEVEPGILAHFILYGFESGHGLFPVGNLHLRSDHERVVAQKLQAARGQSQNGISIASQRTRRQIDRGTK